jgi:HSP20 family molecular chaperone IbpA
MALIPHTFFPRSAFDADLFHRPLESGPRALDIFDPFDDLDMQLDHMIHWLERPQDHPLHLALQPKVPQKYRITVDCAGYDPKSISTKIVGDKLIVKGSEGDEAPTKGAEDDYHHRSFKRTIQLPNMIEKDRMTSFMDKSGTLVIDFPYREENILALNPQDMLPKIVDAPDGHGHLVNLNINLPCHVDPKRVQVTAKDRDVIVHAEDKCEIPNGVRTFSYYRRTTMPSHTDMKSLKCYFDGDSKMSIIAPYHGHHHHHHRALKDDGQKNCN